MDDGSWAFYWTNNFGKYFLVITPKREETSLSLICYVQRQRGLDAPNECQSIELCADYYSQLILGLSQLTSSLSEQIIFKDNHNASFIGIGLKSIVYRLKNDVCNFVSH